MRSFKVTLALAVSLTVFNTFAACLGEICEGDNVLDEYNNVAKVVGIDAEKGEAILRASNGVRSVNPSSLVDEVSSDKFPVGKIVVDEYSIQGIVKMVFRDGRVLYLRNGYSSPTISKTISPEVNQLGDLRDGDRVLDEYTVRGVVSVMFENGQVFYRRDGYSADTSALFKNLSKRVSSYRLLSKDAEVIDEYGVRGKVTDLYSNGVIFYLRRGYSSETSTGNNANLILKTNSIQGLAAGTIVIDEYNVVGKVTELYSDGRVFYLRDGYSSETSTSAGSLSKLTDSISQGTFQAGVNAIDEYSIEGSIKQVFENGKMVFQRNGYSSANIVTNLYPEVDTHPKYSKATVYANDNLKIGKPSRFYANGMVSLSGSVSSTLYEEVRDLDGLSAGSVVISLKKDELRVESIYANRVATLKDAKNKELVLRIGSAKLVKDADIDMTLRNLLFNPDSVNEVYSPEEAVKVKAILVKAARDNTIGLSDDEKKKLLAFFKLHPLDGEEQTPETQPQTTPSPSTSSSGNSETIAVSVTPDTLSAQVQQLLASEHKDFRFTDAVSAAKANNYIILRFSKSFLSGTCDIQIKEGNLQRSISKKGSKDPAKCVNELSN